MYHERYNLRIQVLICERDVEAHLKPENECAEDVFRQRSGCAAKQSAAKVGEMGRLEG
jgi:hypothetical protein